MRQPRDNPAGGQHRPSQLGEFIRAQRRLARLSQRELARLTDLSDPYVSQIERGLHAPSIRVLRSLAAALDISAETMLTYAGLLDPPDSSETTQGRGSRRETEAAIRNDAQLSAAQKEALLAVYRSLLTTDTEPGPA